MQTPERKHPNIDDFDTTGGMTSKGTGDELRHLTDVRLIRSLFRYLGIVNFIEGKGRHGTNP